MKRKPSGTISAKTLQDKIRTVRTEINTADERLFQMHQHRDELQVRLNTYLELLHDVKPDNAEAATGPAKTLTQAAIEYLVEHPGAKASDVVEAMIQMPSNAKDPRKVLHQTLLNLRNAGRIERGDDGSLKVAGSGNGAAPSR